MRDLNNRIQQLTKLILTSDSQAVDEVKGDESRPTSPSKVDFDMSPYQLQQELLSARTQLESQTNQILSLEAALVSRPRLDTSAPEKDKLIVDQAKVIEELEVVVRECEENMTRSLIAVKEDVEKEWKNKLDTEVRRWEEKERWVDELVKELEKEKRARTKLEDERRAFVSFVNKFDSLRLGGTTVPMKPKSSMQTPGGPASLFAEKQRNQFLSTHNNGNFGPTADRSETTEPPLRLSTMNTFSMQPSLLDQVMPEEQWDDDDTDFDVDPTLNSSSAVEKAHGKGRKLNGSLRNLLLDKENVVPPTTIHPMIWQ